MRHKRISGLVVFALFSLLAGWSHAENVRLGNWEEMSATVVRVRVFKLQTDAENPLPHFDLAGMASGTVLSKDGYILTNNHVVEGADKVEVLIGKYIEAKVIGRDPEKDLAVVKAQVGPRDRRLLRPVNFRNKSLHLGERITSFGFLGIGSKRATLSTGVVSNVRVFVGEYSTPLVASDFHGGPGDSGGPVFTEKMEFAGMMKGILTDRSGKNVLNFSGFIPSNVILRVLPRLYRGDVRTSWIGTGPGDYLDMKEAKRDNYLKAEIGGYFSERGLPMPDSPAGFLLVDFTDPAVGSTCSLKIGDIILVLDGKVPRDSHELIQWIAEAKPGSEMRTVVLRGGKRMTVPVRVSEFYWKER